MAEPAGLRILLVDDDPDICRLVQHVLKANGLGTAIEVGSGRAALAALSGIDLVLLDHQLPDTSGLEVLSAIRARPSPPAVILVTAHGNESLAATALRLGADDYLAKDAALADLLPQIVERVRRTRELRKALAAAEQDLVRAERLAAIGEMTVTLHHEINNPLMAAFADVELLLADPAGPPAQRPGLESVREALRRIRDIVQRIGDLREARSKAYLRGLRMLDLAQEEAESAPAVHRGAALLHVGDEDLARVVSLLLREAGFQVRRVETAAELEKAAATIGVTLVVVAHPLAGFVPSASREYLVVALVTGSESAALAAGADHVVHLPFDPGTFTGEILECLARGARR